MFERIELEYSKTSVKAFFGTKKNPALTENRPAIRLYFFPKKPPYCEKYTLKIALNRKFWYSNQNRLKPKIALTEAALNRGLTVVLFRDWLLDAYFILQL